MDIFFSLFGGLETVTIEAGNRGNCETQLVCFLHISDHYPLGPGTQFLKNHSHAYVNICKHMCVCMYIYIIYMCMCIYIIYINLYSNNIAAVVKSFSHVRFFETQWTVACQGSLSFTISWSLLTLVSSEWVMPFNHLVLCHPRLLLPSFSPRIRVFSDESALHIRWTKY